MRAKRILAKNVAKYRKQKGWTQAILAERAALSAASISKIESAETWISAESLFCIAKVLNVQLSELLEKEYKPVVVKKRPTTYKTKRDKECQRFSGA